MEDRPLLIQSQLEKYLSFSLKGIPRYVLPKTVRIMTYNIHSCKGRDGKISPERTAEVISHYRPDIVALQEIRVGRTRSEVVDRPSLIKSGEISPSFKDSVSNLSDSLPPLVTPPPAGNDPPFVDQPAVIAGRTRMHYIFYPLLHTRLEDYGIAILSRHAMHLKRAGNLPTLPDRPLLERRGALWVKVSIDGIDLHVINTHLGLNRREREAQVKALLGGDWSVHPEFRPPFIICGDMNAWPWAATYRHIRQSLDDAQLRAPRYVPHNTWPSFFPLLRLDHIFVPPRYPVFYSDVPRTRLTLVNSDHLPVIADIPLEDIKEEPIWPY